MEMPAMGRAGDQCGGEWVGVGRGLHVCSRVVRVFHALGIWLDSQKGEIELVGLREEKKGSKQASKQIANLPIRPRGKTSRKAPYRQIEAG